MADRDAHTPHHASRQTVRAIVVTPRDGAGPPFLIVEIDIDCAVCGGFTAQIAGHHTAALAESLAGIVAEHPGLAGTVSGESRRTEWSGTAPGPGKEQLN